VAVQAHREVEALLHRLDAGRFEHFLRRKQTPLNVFGNVGNLANRC
jgi:hypothetical protein